MELAVFPVNIAGALLHVQVLFNALLRLLTTCRFSLHSRIQLGILIIYKCPRSSCSLPIDHLSHDVPRHTSPDDNMTSLRWR